MDLWPAWMILTVAIGGPSAAYIIWFVDNSIDAWTSSRKRRWTLMG